MAGIAAAALLSSLLSPAPAPGQAAVHPEILAQVTGARAYGHVLELSQRIGPHVAGTPEDRTSGAYIARQLANDGYAVEWQAFPFPFFAVRATTVAVLSHPAVAVHPHAMISSPSSPSAGLMADLVDVGLGRPEDVREKALRGKIALILRGTLQFREKASNVAA